MESLNQSTLTPTKTKLSRTFAKVLHIQKTKSAPKHKPLDHQNEKLVHVDQVKNNATTMDAFVAKLFATVSSVKTAYAQLQVAQSPYDPEVIQSADQIMVCELKKLSELKQLFLKKHVDDDINSSPETTLLLAEIQENKNLVQMYDISVKKLDSQNKLKDSEIIFLNEKLNEINNENKIIERRLKLNSSEKINDFSCRTLKSFLLSLQQTTRSIKSFVRLMMCEMEEANWDINAAASAIHPNVVFSDTSECESECFAFESFVCGVMFDGFNNPGFSITKNGFDPMESFMELKSSKSQDYINVNPNSLFAKYCYFKYLKLVHPVMEFSIFGNLNQRNLVSAGKFPETNFFVAFADMARHVWLLHCLSLTFDTNKTSVFQVRVGSRFTEVYMEGVNEEPPSSLMEPKVGFTVVPGFKVGGSVIQCQVYLT